MSDSEEDNLIGPPIPQSFKQIHEKNENFCKDASSTKEQDSSIHFNLQDITDEEFIGPPIPSNLKVKNDTTISNSDSDEELIGPPIPYEIFEKTIDKTHENKNSPNLDNSKFKIPQPIVTSLQADRELDHKSLGNLKIQDSHEDNDDYSDDDENDDDNKRLPIGCHVTIKHGGDPISAIAVDPAGARLATGSMNFDIKFWDFAGMDNTFQSFRRLTPCGSHAILGLHYSCTGDALLIISGSSQAKVLDRDGHELVECVKGDKYVYDTARTKGHTSNLYSGRWHPRKKEEFITTASDGTCRFWDVNNAKEHKNIIKCSQMKTGLRNMPISSSYNMDGTFIALGCIDGEIQIYDTRRLKRPASRIVGHTCNEFGVTCVVYSHIGNLLATRAGDNKLKLWDVRKLKDPLFEASDILVRYEFSDCQFSPNDELLLTTTNAKHGTEESGKLMFFDTRTFEVREELLIKNTLHAVRTVWHPRLQQIFIGCAEGAVNIYYNESSMSRGAQLAAERVRRKKKQVEVVAGQQIITPHALPMFRQDRPKSTRKKIEKDRLDPVKSRRPDLPIKSGQGGRLAASGSTLSSYVIRNLGLSKRVEDDQDPREAILKYAKEAAENPYWISPAYKKTQPTTIFQNDQENEDGDDEPANKKTKI